MPSCCSCRILTLPFEYCSKRLVRPGNIFPFFCCLLLLQPICFTVRHVVRPKITRLHTFVVKISLYDLLIPPSHLKSVWPFSSDLWGQQGFFTHRTGAHSVVSLFQTCALNLRLFKNNLSSRSVSDMLRPAEVS